MSRLVHVKQESRAGAFHHEHALSEHGGRFDRFPLSLAKQLIRAEHLAQK